MNNSSATNPKNVETQIIPWSYSDPIDTKERVRLAVPKKSEYMKLTDPHSFENADGQLVSVPARWIHRSVFVGKGIERVILRRNFYGIIESDLGKAITATVVVRERTRGSIMQTFMDITKTGNSILSRPEYDLKITENAEGVLIKGTLVNICFISRASCDNIMPAEAAAT